MWKETPMSSWSKCTKVIPPTTHAHRLFCNYVLYYEEYGCVQTFTSKKPRSYNKGAQGEIKDELMEKNINKGLMYVLQRKKGSSVRKDLK